MRISSDRICLPIALFVFAASANAEDDSWWVTAPWYGSVSTGFLIVSEEARFFGPTQSVYGGSPGIDIDDGVVYSIEIGRELPGNWRIGMELRHSILEPESGNVLGTDQRSEDVFRLDGEIDSTALLFKLGYEFNNLTWWATPYVEGGLGVSRNTVSTPLSVEYNSAIWNGTSFEGQVLNDYSFPEDTATQFAAAVAAGLKLQFSSQFSLQLEYGFSFLNDAGTDFDEEGDAIGISDITTQQLSFGIEYRF
ncbi:MAG: outer membrane beta-barrel protein [Pseudomonadota bacterium]